MTVADTDTSNSRFLLHDQTPLAEAEVVFVPWSFVVAGAGWRLPPTENLSSLFCERMAARGVELEHFDAASLPSCFALNKRIKKLLDERCN